MVGHQKDTDEIASRWLTSRRRLVVQCVAINENLVRIAVRDAGLDSLLAALRQLVDRGGSSPDERLSQFQLRLLPSDNALKSRRLGNEDQQYPVMNAATGWVHAILRAAVARLVDTGSGSAGASLTSAPVADYLDDRPALTALPPSAEVEAASDTLAEALAEAATSNEPLAVSARSLALTTLEFRVMVLALGPELDPRHQRWISLLMEEVGRRVGSLGLYAELLGEPSHVSRELAQTGNLARWRLFEDHAKGTPAADAPLRLDPPFRDWLVGADDLMEHDPMLRRIVRATQWPGGGLIDSERATRLIRQLQDRAGRHWIVVDTDNPRTLAALVEAGADDRDLEIIRIEVTSLHNLDCNESRDCGVRVARLSRLHGKPIVIDASGLDNVREHIEATRTFLLAIGSVGCQGTIITAGPAHIVELLGSAAYVVDEQTIPPAMRVSALHTAAAGADTSFSDEAAEAIANLYPLRIDGFEHAMRLARSQSLQLTTEEARRNRFIAACKAIAAAGASGLAQRIEPVFQLDEVVLPADRKSQLEEIVDNVRFASRVLDAWKFGDQLPYGRGVTALFHGPSGTGKTMAALAVARQLNIQILKIDLSRIVSKYIGDTEKNIDRVFMEAQLSGAAVLVDEAEGLMARRSEINDAHDRYANIEVAYLLQRMEAHEGLVILTTNMRQNLDTAFLRRLRFVIDFPRPDATAREAIWRYCLPDGSHMLDDATFRILARKIELTGGNVRQITLRAAFLAAAAGVLIGPEQVLHASKAELAKLGLPTIEIDLAERRRAA
ncbi:mlr6544 [Mesorhizobium japonicum MAFF 303099]|uniref:Mlr6544 protein n=1 Tax=Mesorhizobium japonicum (strain LMG 29417 / CECT 9101 / MAFF 303099) TaxID=266835 RepID=Q988Y2_RHILO|nr:mlr6544 [Mesorhizobium japonicum MAFF 303099]